MSCNSAKTDHNTCMLDRIILIIKSCTHCAYIFTHAITQEFFQTVRINDLCIIVKQKQILTLCKRCTIVINGRIVKDSVPVYHADLRILCLQFFVIFKSSRICTVILYNNVLIIFVRRFLFNGFHTSLQIINMVFIRNNNRNQRIMISDKLRSVQPQIFTLKNLCADSCSLIVSLYCTSSGFKGIKLALGILCCGVLMATPVIQDFWNMTDFFILYCFHTA